MAQFKKIETADGKTFVINRDYVVMYEPKYGDPAGAGHMTIRSNSQQVTGFRVAKSDQDSVMQWLLED